MTSLIHYNNLCLATLPYPLTESIDWLIQVRYGNGDGDNGLTKLSEALKKLIEEAIEKATNSLSTEKKKLECPFKYSDKETTCQFYQKLIDKFPEAEKSGKNTVNGFKKEELEKWKKDCESSHSRRYDDATKRALQDIDSKLISLGDLAVKLGGFVGQSDKVTEAIKKAKECLEKQLKKCERCKNSDNHHTSDDCQDPENCQSVQQKIEKLQSFQTTNETSQKNPNELLNNLCTGLEKFLGFDSTSKGYTGQGVVYSDLDRLCDAVMGFLSGVLSNIKEHLGQHKDKIEPVIRILEDNKHRGKNGFNVAIGKVVEGVRGYNDKVRESNTKIADPISKMIAYVGDKGELTNGLNALQVTDDPTQAEKEATKAYELVKKWLPKIRECIAGMYNKQDIDDLNNKLMLRVYDARDCVAHEYTRLSELSKKEKQDLDEITLKIKSTLTSMKEGVCREIVNQVRALVMELKTKVKTIKTQLDSIKKLLQNYVKALEQWMEAALEVIKAAENRITRDILSKVQDGHTDNRNQGGKTTIHKQADELRQKGNGLLEAYRSAHEALETLMPRIDTAVQGLENLYKQKIADVAKEVSRKVQMAQSALTGLGGRVKDGLNELKNEIDTPISNVIDKLKAGIERAAGAQGAYLVIQNFGELLDKDNTPKLRDWAAAAKSSGSLKGAMDALGRHDGDFNAFKAVLSKLKEDQNDKGTFYSVLIDDLKTKVTAAIDDVRNGSGGKSFDHIFSQFSEAIKKGSEASGTVFDKLEAITKFGVGIERKVGATMSGEYDISPMKFENYNNGNAKKQALTNAIENVKTKTLQSFDGKVDEIRTGKVEGKKEELTTFVKSITDELATIAGLIDNNAGTEPNGSNGDKDGLMQKLAELRRLIGKDSRGSQNNEILQGLRNNLDTLVKGELDAVITLATNFPREADIMRNHAITTLQSVVEEQVRKCRKTLTTLAQKQYVAAIEELLSAFAAKVTAELTNLPDAIEKDKHTGFKGFMEALAGGNDRNIKLLDGQNDAKRVQDLSYAFNASWQPMHDYLNKEIKRVTNENNKRNPKSEAPQPYLSGLSKITDSLNALLTHITEKNKYDCQTPGLLDSLESAVGDLTPQGFANPNSAILDVITSGLAGFIGELRNVYISRYDGAKAITWDGTFTDKAPEESRNGVKVFLTIQKMLSDDLTELYTQLTEKTVLRGLKIYASSDDKANTLGDLLQKCGYKLGSENGRQDGEVQCSAKMMGRNILGHLTQNIQNAHYNEHLKKCRPNKKRYNFGLIDVIACIFQHVNQYYTVCHLPTIQSSKLPCNIYQMLSWLCGLTYNQVYPQLSLNAFSDLFDKPEQSAPADSEDVSFVDETADTLPAYPHEVSVGNLSTTLMEVCHHSYEVLCAILGHGHAGGGYACDFNTNPDKLSYPSNPSKCLDLCIEILLRLYNQLYFIYVQCHRASNAVSWRDCYYGRHVGGSSWECNEIRCADLIANQNVNQIANQNVNQIANQNADQTCEQHPKCGIKSPLQSFLEDGLPGFLPHPFKTPNCKLTCEAPNHRGIPCKTPMGFADISVTASHTKKGSHLADALAAFCGTPNTPLAAICASLTCLLQRAPQTLDDMFSFYYHLLKGWNGNNSKRNTHKSYAFNGAVTKAHFGEAYVDLDITTIFKGSDHKTGNHVNGELHSLFTCDYGNKTEIECGRYMQPFGHNIWTVFSDVNADKYLTWIVYLTETFYDLLKKLYEECCKNCKTPGSRCHGKTCHQNCLVSHTSTHSKTCRSIARCPFTRPTLCKYGFVFQSESNLSGTYGPETKRTCQDFCNALNKVLKKG